MIVSLTKPVFIEWLRKIHWFYKIKKPTDLKVDSSKEYYFSKNRIKIYVTFINVT